MMLLWIMVLLCLSAVAQAQPVHGGVGGLDRDPSGSCLIPKEECKNELIRCSRIYLPVCGCDGVTYSNECMSMYSCIRRSTLGACPTSA
ncbi:hypothetical protein B484DRAFT_444945 [Ochromonadaceae sp. CCMP2298]|nr:hypothetical protein B484DRAFT_444945 [Ochromonadaceae sp. CCMP2298]